MAGIVGGNALVVLLIIAAAAFVEGMGASLSIRHDSRNVIVLGAGSEESAERSEISAAVPSLLAAAVPGIAQAAGEPFISPEIVSALIVRESAEAQEELRAVVRGIAPGAFLVHARVEIVEGRAPMAGANELLAGSLAADKLGLAAERLAVGQSLWFDGREWRVCGRMSARGTVMDAELWTALPDLMAAAKRDTLSCVVATLDTAEFADIDAFTKMRTDLELAALTEAEYYASLLRFYGPVRAMIWATAVLAALAGLLGGLNSMYAAFSARGREMAMLQSLGYPRRAIAFSLVQESLLAASIGLLGAAAAGWLLLDGLAVPFSMGVFQLHIGSRVLAAGAACAVATGLLGALPPAWSCLRPPIPEALKST